MEEEGKDERGEGEPMKSKLMACCLHLYRHPASDLEIE